MRLTPRTIVIAVGLFLSVFVLFAFIGSVVLKDPAPPPVCGPTEDCGGPPEEGGPGPIGGGAASTPPGAPASPAPVGIRAGKPWASTELGFEFEYWPGWFEVKEEGPREVEFRILDDEESVLQVAGVPASEASAQQYAERWFKTLSETISDLKLDESGKNAILGAEIGFVDGPGLTYAGSISNAQGGLTPVGVSLVVASDGRTTVAVVLTVRNPGKPIGKVWLQHDTRGLVELVLKTFRWGSGT